MQSVAAQIAVQGAEIQRPLRHTECLPDGILAAGGDCFVFRLRVVHLGDGFRHDGKQSLLGGKLQCAAERVGVRHAFGARPPQGGAEQVKKYCLFLCHTSSPESVR